MPQTGRVRYARSPLIGSLTKITICRLYYQINTNLSYNTSNNMSDSLEDAVEYKQWAGGDDLEESDRDDKDNLSSDESTSQGTKGPNDNGKMEVTTEDDPNYEDTLSQEREEADEDFNVDDYQDVSRVAYWT